MNRTHILFGCGVSLALGVLPGCYLLGQRNDLNGCDFGQQDNDNNGECLPSCLSTSLRCGEDEICSDLTGQVMCVKLAAMQQDMEMGITPSDMARVDMFTSPEDMSTLPTPDLSTPRDMPREPDLVDMLVVEPPDEDDFVTVWDTRNPGASGNTEVELPVQGDDFDFDVDWESDGIFDDTGINGPIRHDYGTPGVYTITIRGTFPRFQFQPDVSLHTQDSQKLIEVRQWGDQLWRTMAALFFGCEHVSITANDQPELRRVEDMSFAFAYASNFNDDINDWEVDDVEMMTSTFAHATSFNQPLDRWDMSSVTDTSGMFQNATSFDQDISNWDFFGVQTMDDMFSGATSFDQDLSRWDIEDVVSMKGMFDNSGLSRLNYDKLLLSWSRQNVQDSVEIGVEGLTFCAGKNARQYLIDEYRWTFIGDREDCL